MSSLKASHQGLEQIRQARKAKNWAIEDPRWLTAASQCLDPQTDWASPAFTGIFAAGISLSTWKRFLQGKPINAKVFDVFCQLLNLNGETVSDRPMSPMVEPLVEHAPGSGDSKQGGVSTVVHWGTAPDIPAFFGRHHELALLAQWLFDDQCRLVAILGMGGSGKTALSVKLVELASDTTRSKKVQDSQGNSEVGSKHWKTGKLSAPFQFIVWRSLLNAPPITTLLIDLLQALSADAASTVSYPGSHTVDELIAQLLDILRSQRCLLVFDNVETILQAGSVVGQYRDGYEGYGQLLKLMGEVPHQSCLLLTSREKPKEVARLDGKNRPVRSLGLQGLMVEDGKQIFAEIGSFQATEPEWQTLITGYRGNPLALELTAKHIDEVFQGNITSFFQQGNHLFQDVRELLDWHVSRLSKQEQEIAYWLSIHREPVAIADLKAALLSPAIRDNLPTLLQALQRRFPLERHHDKFKLHSVLIEYLNDQLIEQSYQEIQTATFHVLKKYALLQATASDHIRDSQRHLIVQPIIERLHSELGSSVCLDARLSQCLERLKHQSAIDPGYAAGNLINLLAYGQAYGHYDLSDRDFSHQVIRQADLSQVTLHRTTLADSELYQSVFAETFSGVLCVAFHPAGNLLAASDTTGEILIRQISTAKQLSSWKAHSYWTWAIAFSPNGQVLASVGDDYWVKLWDVTHQTCLKQFKGHTYSVNAVTFSPDGHTLATSGQDSTIRLWDVSPLALQSSPETVDTCLHVLNGHTKRIWAIAFSPDGKTLVSASEDRTIKRWHVDSGDCYETLHGHSDWVKCIAFSHTGKYFASGSMDQTIKLWDSQTGQLLATCEGHTKAITAIVFSLDDQTLISCSNDRTIKLWDLRHVEVENSIQSYSDRILSCFKTLQGHTNRVWSVALSPDGHHLASGGDDHAIKLWEMETGNCTQTWKGYTNTVLSLALHSQQSLLASGHEDETIKVWHLDSKQLGQVLQGHIDRVWSVAFMPPLVNASLKGCSPESIILASASADRTIKLWDCTTGQCLTTLEGHTSWVWSIAINFTSEHQRFASASYDQTIKLWDIKTGKCLTTLAGHTAPVVQVAFGSGGRWLASSSFDKTIKLWDMATGQCVQTLHGHTNSVWQIAFRPVSADLLQPQTMIASGSFDHTVKLWDITTGQCLQTLHGHEDSVVAIAFSPDGRYLFSGSFDQTIKQWDIETGRCIQTFNGHEGVVSAIVCSTDAPTSSVKKGQSGASNQSPASVPGNVLVSASFDETIKLWDLPTGQCLQTLRAPRPYEGMTISRIKGLTDAQIINLKLLGAIEDAPSFS